MSIERIPLVITTGTNASGTAASPYPIEGRILEIIAPAAATALFGPGGTAVFTATRGLDGGTVLALTTASAPFRNTPRVLANSTTAGTAVAYDLSGGQPCADYLTLTLSAAGTSASGTVYVYYDRDRRA